MVTDDFFQHFYSEDVQVTRSAFSDTPYHTYIHVHK